MAFRSVLHLSPFVTTSDIPVRYVMDNRASRRRQKLSYVRSLWGSTGSVSGDPGEKIAKIGRLYEAQSVPLLQSIGFSDIYHVSIEIPAFPFDFIATKDGRRVLLDVTTRVWCRTQPKFKLAGLMGLNLYIVHISPADPETFYVHQPRTGSYSIPMDFFHRLAERRGVNHDYICSLSKGRKQRVRGVT